MARKSDSAEHQDEPAAVHHELAGPAFVRSKDEVIRRGEAGREMAKRLMPGANNDELEDLLRLGLEIADAAYLSAHMSEEAE